MLISLILMKLRFKVLLAFAFFFLWTLFISSIEWALSGSSQLLWFWVTIISPLSPSVLLCKTVEISFPCSCCDIYMKITCRESLFAQHVKTKLDYARFLFQLLWSPLLEFSLYITLLLCGLSICFISIKTLRKFTCT